MDLDFNALRDLLAAINQTDVAEFTLKSGDFELIVRKGGQINPHLMTQAIGQEGIAPMPMAPAPMSVAPPVVSAPAPTGTPLVNDRLVDVTSPMVGTFYRSPAPDEPPYVNVGDRIRPNQVVCIVEAMKLMNEVEAEVSGEIVEILVENAQPVEYGQVLMRVNPG
ncbi:MAG: acetyl-CoA carboxylase biotin carboxyl carrier protein [Elainellaceae cyanobacterium]